MKAAKATLLLLLSNSLTGCSSSSFISRRNGASPVAFKSASSRGGGGRRRDSNGAHDVLDLRGGQQQSDGSAGGSTGSYHGNYVSQVGEEPKAAATAANTATATVVETVAPPPQTAPPVLASAASTNSKISNLQERTGPAVLMLAATSLLLKFTGSNGLIGLVFVMQLAMYSESTSVVESFTKNKGGSVGDEDIVSFPLQKWWWFATAMMFTSGRCVMKKYVSIFHTIKFSLFTHF